MKVDSSKDYRRGTVSSWQHSPVLGYHGYIRPEDAETGAQLILINSESLRNPGALLQPGARVFFTTESGPRGILASDVYLLPEGSAGADDGIERVTGLVRDLHPLRYFGIIELSDGRTALFHFSELTDPDSPPRHGTPVSCRVLTKMVHGVARLTAIDLAPEKRVPSADTESRTRGLLARALLAREEGRFDAAAKLYEEGLRKWPSVQLFLSYAAMERTAHGYPQQAMQIFERGIVKFPRNPKLHEDAGLLAASMANYPKALEFLRAALRFSREPGQAGEKGILLNLARTCYRMGSRDTFEQAVRYYEEAILAFGEKGLPFERDKLTFNLARVRIQHYRGELAVRFFQAAGFEIRQAELHRLTTTSADMVLRTDKPELIDSYGLSDLLLVRCMFQSEVTTSDLRELDQKIKVSGEAHVADGQVALLVVASLTPTIERMLYARIADRRELKPAIVPISQAEIERASDAVTALRTAFDKWLFKRDLFAVNAPVFGDRFFGRVNPVAEIRDAISVSKPIGIFGLRKVGKTSILHEIERRSSESGDVVLYMDLLSVPEDVTDTKWLYWDLASQLRDKSQHFVTADFFWRLGGVFTDFLAIPHDFAVATAFDSDLKRVLNVIQTTTISPRPKVVLMLDEVERLLPTRLGEPGFKGFFGFFSYFRGVSQQTADFTIIVTAANPAIQEAAQFEARDNPVFNYFKEVYLKFLEPTECRQMITQLGKGMGIRFDSDAYDLIYTLTGGHPFVARQLCSFLAETFDNRPLRLTRAMVDSILDAYLDLKAEKDFNEIFERLSRDFPEERDACIVLARQNEPLAIARLIRDEKQDRLRLRHLIGYQLIQIIDGKVSLSIDLMKRWLRHSYAREAE